jgi:uncharacterized protein (TIGR02145 family)
VRDGCSHFVVSGFAESIENTGVWRGGAYNYGFSALLGGNYDYYDSSFYGAGSIGGSWWTAATENDSSYAYCRGMDYNSDYVVGGSCNKSNGFSVRCVAD